MSVNQVTLLGRAGKDPEVRTVGQSNRKAARRGFVNGYVYGMQRELKEQIMSMIKPW